MRQLGRKRSAAITLVLAGSASLGGCGSPAEQRDAYASLQDCVKDWSDTSLCEPVRDGRYSTSYLYGPPYDATSGWSLFGRSPRQRRGRPTWTTRHAGIHRLIFPYEYSAYRQESQEGRGIRSVMVARIGRTRPWYAA